MPRKFEKQERGEMNARRRMIWIENDQIGDGYFAPLLAEALREYAGFVEGDYPVKHQPEVFVASNGTRITGFSGTWLGDEVHPAGPPTPSLATR